MPLGLEVLLVTAQLAEQAGVLLGIDLTLALELLGGLLAVIAELAPSSS